MKKIFVFALILCLALAGMAFGAESQKDLIFTWDQSAGDLISLDKWVLHVREAAGGPDVQTVDVPFTGGVGPFSANQNFTVTGDPGCECTRFFVLTAVSKNGSLSGPSNEVSQAFDIPWDAVSAPINLTVQVAQ